MLSLDVIVLGASMKRRGSVFQAVALKLVEGSEPSRDVMLQG